MPAKRRPVTESCYKRKEHGGGPHTSSPITARSVLSLGLVVVEDMAVMIEKRQTKGRDA